MTPSRPIAGWVAHQVIRLYPEDFRVRYGPAMALAFVERLDHQRQARGRIGTASFALGALCDMAIHGVRERRLVRQRAAMRRHTFGDSMQTLLQDIRFGIRLLAKARGFTVVATLVLALGIGSTTAVFGIINNLMIASRPGHPDGEVIGVYSRDRERPDSYRSVSYAAFDELRARPNLFSALAGQNFGLAGLTEGDVTRRIFGAIVTAGFFDTFGAPPARGRAFTREEEAPGADIPVTVLSHDLWIKLGGTADILGSSLTINTRAYTVIGVAAEGFGGSSVVLGPELWVPTGVHDAFAFTGPRDSMPFGDPRNRTLLLVGRLPSGYSEATVAAQLEATALDLERADPVANENADFLIAPLARMSIGTDPGDDTEIMSFVFVLLAMSGVVMFISALNVANMLLARAGARRKELAIRLAIGGSRWRVMRQLLTEGLILSLLGGAAGVALASWANMILNGALISAFNSVISASVFLDARPDAFVLWATFASCIVCTLAFSLGPAWRMIRSDSMSALREQSGEISRGGSRWTASALVTGQVALSLVLLTVAGLFVQMSARWADRDPGFSFDRGVLIDLDPSLAGYDRERSASEFGQVLDRLRQLPQVEAASLGSTMAFGTTTTGRSIQRPGPTLRRGDPGAEDGLVGTVWITVGAQYFDALGLTMARGREFSEAEARSPDATVAIIDAAAADRLFDDENPIGQIIQYAGPTIDAPPVSLQIVGIAPPIQHEFFETEPGPHLYTPFGGNVPQTALIHVRTSAPSAEAEAAMLPSFREELRAINPDLPVLAMQTLPMFRDQSMNLAIMRMGSTTFMSFGLMALFMATIGVYGVKAYLVASRTREISIRVTLGAQPSDVLWMVLRQGLGVAVTGVVIGVALSLAASMAVEGVVLQGESFDLGVFSLTAAVLVAAVMLASWLPARRATRVSATQFMRT